MGTYYLHRIHPFTVGECGRPGLPAEPLQEPVDTESADRWTLVEHGRFLEPFVRRDSRFTRRWRPLRHELLARKDLRDLARVADHVRAVKQLSFSNKPQKPYLTHQLGVFRLPP